MKNDIMYRNYIYIYIMPRKSAKGGTEGGEHPI